MYNKEKANMRKRIAVTQFGGICECCNYKFISMAQAHFHHIDSTTKAHNMAAMWNSYSDSKISEELAKCMLLCSNCHDALHELYGESVNATESYDFIKAFGNHSDDI